MLDIITGNEALDILREGYPGAFHGWDESKIRITIDENDGGHVYALFMLFNLQVEQKQPERKHDKRRRGRQKPEKKSAGSGGEKVYKIHQVFLTDLRTDKTKVGGEELISEFYTLVDAETL